MPLGLILTTLVSSTAAYAGDLHFLREAMEVYEQTLTNLQACGLTRVDHEDPRLPRPRVDADEAIVGRGGQVLAYTNYVTGLSNLIEIKNPNGGLVHSIAWTSESIEYMTPFVGSVAATTRSRSIDGWRFRFLCRSRYVSYEAYKDCVASEWIDVVTSQLCR